MTPSQNPKNPDASATVVAPVGQTSPAKSAPVVSAETVSPEKPPAKRRSLHPQTTGKNKLANPPANPKLAPAPSAPVAPSPAVSTATTRRTLRHDDPLPEIPAPIPSPDKDRSYYEMTVAINGSNEPPFTVEVPLTGNGANDNASARAVASKKFPGKAMTIISSRIYRKSANAVSEMSPGSTLSMLFGTPGGATEDLIEIGRAFYDGGRGAIFLRNMRSHVGLTFRPSTGGLVVFSNRIVSNRLASELPTIVAEVLGNGAREIELFLK